METHAEYPTRTLKSPAKRSRAQPGLSPALSQAPGSLPASQTSLSLPGQQLCGILRAESMLPEPQPLVRAGGSPGDELGTHSPGAPRFLRNP